MHAQKLSLNMHDISDHSPYYKTDQVYNRQSPCKRAFSYFYITKNIQDQNQ